jgi:hypothetical protein
MIDRHLVVEGATEEDLATRVLICLFPVVDGES